MSEKLMRIQKAYQIPTYKEQLNIIHENISWFMEMYFWYLENENTKKKWALQSVRFWLKEKERLINLHKEEE